MKNRKIFLLTYFPANYIFGGGAIVRELLNVLDKTFKITWYYTTREKIKIGSNEKSIDGILLKKIALLPKIKYTNTIIDYLFFYIGARFIAYRISKKIKKEDILWIVLDKELIPISYYLIKHNNYTTHISLHDDCRSYYKPYSLINYSTNHFLNTLFSKATSIDMISNKLIMAYDCYWKNKPIVYRRGVNVDEIKSPKLKNNYNLLFLGASHSNLCWDLFIKKISEFKFHFTITVIGKTDFLNYVEPLINTTNNISIKTIGTVKEEDIQKHTKEMDFGIFFFDYFDVERLKTSVSTKFTGYARLGLPIIGTIYKDSEHFELIEEGIAFEIKDKTEVDFENWIKNYNTEKYLNYLNEKFNSKKMLTCFLNSAAFK